ncbi:MAG: competence/damage-inducible protein CinA C-terminal domain protein [Halonotius sp. J07HN6]|nr:MAG: competence/damage-inducible protein CinA C-terminal domain protein [Halonotius sp. J07HN6]ERH05679.1 MAG: competence/damage-inducible protein CinA C-terminal domain protein [Halonotius sp. J07HN4]
MADSSSSEPPEAILGDRLTEREETVAVAESLTGGLVCSRLTDIPGSSDYFDRGVVAYSNDAKLEALAVSRESLDDHGAVSESVAAEMARGVRDTADTTWGVSTTGIAGPTGGTDEKPVGLVFVGVAYAGPWGTESSFVSVNRHVFDGDRAAVKDASATAALSALGDAIDEVAGKST